MSIPAKRVDYVSVKLVKESSFLYKDRVCNSTTGAYQLFSELIEDKPDEHLAVACLNTKLEPVNVAVLSIGSVTQANVYCRSVIRNALLSNAISVIVAHNHPSGNVTPSKNDVAFTKRLAKACAFMGINLLDHLVIGADGDFTSLKSEEGEIFE